MKILLPPLGRYRLKHEAGQNECSVVADMLYVVHSLPAMRYRIIVNTGILMRLRSSDDVGDIAYVDRVKRMFPRFDAEGHFFDRNTQCQYGRLLFLGLD